MSFKVLTLVGTRPEIIKLSRVIARLDEYVSHVLVHSGQNYDYGLNEIFFQQLGIRKPDYFLDAAGETAAATIANAIARTDDVLAREKPDAFLLLGDTNSCLGAIAAKRRRIPVFHMEAGNRCFDDRVPEEINRRIVDHISDINLTYTEHARRYLLAEGLRPETVIKTGSPMKEVLDHHAEAIEHAGILSDLGLTPQEYFLVSAHREETVDDFANLDGLLACLNAISDAYGLPVVMSTHPRTRKRLKERGIPEGRLPRVRLVDPLGFIDYVKLQKEARCTISDSGTITEESSLMGFPAVTIRESHERPEGMDEATLIMSVLQPDRLLQAIGVVTKQAPISRFRTVRDYDVDNVSYKVVRIILSYVDYVNRTVWHTYPNQPSRVPRDW